MLLDFAHSYNFQFFPINNFFLIFRDDDYYNPHSVASIKAAEEEQMQEDETIEEFEDRVLNKRAGHLNKILQSKFEENVILVDFKDLIRRNMRKQVAQKFYSILVLQKVEAVKINQDKPYDPIMVEKGPKFDISVIYFPCVCLCQSVFPNNPFFM